MEWNFLFFFNSGLLGVGLAMDAFSVSMANGLHDPKMSVRRMCIIAGAFGVFQAVMPMTGWVCVHTIVELFSSFEMFIPWIALILLAYIGGKMLLEGIRGEETEEAIELSAGALFVQGVKSLPAKNSFNAVLLLNVVILTLAGILFGFDKALYSIIFQYASTQVLHVLYKKYQQQTLFIVTGRPREVCEAIYQISHHGATILEGEGSFEHCQRNVVYSVVDGSKSKKVIQAVRKVDEKAFINEMKTQQLTGHFYQKPAD